MVWRAASFQSSSLASQAQMHEGCHLKIVSKYGDTMIEHREEAKSKSGRERGGEKDFRAEKKRSKVHRNRKYMI